MSKSTKLKGLLNSSSLEFLMEAHNGISAKIVEESGFKGIWASGLSISASLGVRDNNEASWTQVLDVIEFMSDATSIPILLDGDTGFGNFNNMRRLVQKLEQRSIGGVCIEDKLFPKTNSFIAGEAQPLAAIDEFCGKIKAGKDSQTNDDFVVVARVEAFIAGWGLSEALRRAEAYRLAGADAVLIHSKKSSAEDIQAFMSEWDNRHPVVIVPTKYYSTPTDSFRNLGISTVIWANHNMRAGITAMQNTSRQIFEDESLINVEGKVAGVDEIFRLQGAQELKEAESKYLVTAGKNVNVVILAASRGDRLGALTKDIPKTLIKVKGKSVLDTQVDHFNAVGIKDLTVVRGFAKDKINPLSFKIVDNDDHETTKELYSLYLARDSIKENTVISYGDVVFKPYVLNDLMNDSSDIAIIADADFSPSDTYQDFVSCDQPYSKEVFSSATGLKEVSSSLESDKIHGEFIGLWKVSAKGADIVKQALEELSSSGDIKSLRMADLFNHILETNTIAVHYVKSAWLDIDDIVSLQQASEL